MENYFECKGLEFRNLWWLFLWVMRFLFYRNENQIKFFQNTISQRARTHTHTHTTLIRRFSCDETARLHETVQEVIRNNSVLES